MIEIKESTTIRTPSENIWCFLTSLHIGDNYKCWHPKDHLMFKAIKGDQKHTGDVGYFEEFIGKRSLKARYVLKKAIFPIYLEYGACFPLSLLHIITATFEMRKVDAETSEFIAYVGYGYNIPIIGSVLDFFVQKLYPTEVARKHIQEEGDNIKQILENEG